MNKSEIAGEFQPPPDSASREEIIGVLQYWVLRAKKAERAIAESQAPPIVGMCARLKDEWFPLHQKPHKHLDNCLDWKPVSSETTKRELGDGEPSPVNELLESARHHVMTDEEKEAQRQSWVRGEMALSECPPVEPCQCVCHKVGLFGLMCCPCTRKALDELVNGKRTEPAIPSGAAQEVSPPSPDKFKAALEMIENYDSSCECDDHTQTECCANVSVTDCFCAHCIAGKALL